MRVCRWAAGALAGMLVWCALFCAQACPAKKAAPWAEKSWWGVLYENALWWAAEEKDEGEEAEWVWPLWDWVVSWMGFGPAEKEAEKKPCQPVEIDGTREENSALIR